MRNVIIVGMPRSGTSLAASIFVDQGYFTGDTDSSEMRRGDEFNPDGYFELNSLVEANVEILNRAGFPDHNTWLYEPITERCISAIDDLERLESDRRLLNRFNERQPWIWKDPRLCYTLSYWWPLIDPETTSVVITRRATEEIWNSFLRLGWRTNTTEHQFDVNHRIDDHIGTAKAAIDKYHIPHLEISYEDYRNDPISVASRLSKAFGFRIESSELGFRKAYDHSGLRGKIEQCLERVANAQPAGLRTLAKKLIPASVVRLLLPSRRQ